MAGRAFIIRGIFTASTLGQPIAPAMSSFPIVEKHTENGNRRCLQGSWGEYITENFEHARRVRRRKLVSGLKTRPFPRQLRVSARDDVSVKDGGRSTSPSKLRIYGSVATSVFTRRDALLLQQESEVSITGIAATGKPWCTLGASSSLVQFIGI
uniref:Uncharacterized protein n=1 Tax=Vespula pensylvanica TaxID=30213 RepID=A0A834NG41_VESPE|nr:hypothetical protein H0235_014385 [Vespula pensylvanica]